MHVDCLVEDPSVASRMTFHDLAVGDFFVKGHFTAEELNKLFHANGYDVLRMKSHPSRYRHTAYNVFLGHEIIQNPPACEYHVTKVTISIKILSFQNRIKVPEPDYEED